MSQREAEKSASEDAFAIWCHQVAVQTWNKPEHQEWEFQQLIGDENVRNAFEAGYQVGLKAPWTERYTEAELQELGRSIVADEPTAADPNWRDNWANDYD